MFGWFYYLILPPNEGGKKLSNLSSKTDEIEEETDIKIGSRNVLLEGVERERERDRKKEKEE